MGKQGSHKGYTSVNRVDHGVFDGETLGAPWGVKRAVREKFSNFTLHQNYFWESSINYLK